MSELVDLVEQRSIIVCTGTGGVGKTTTSAVLAVEAARRGRRAVVVTIDPAKRLADTLGIDQLGNTPVRIEGDWPGELSALMLDTKSTFDHLVRTYAGDDEQAERIFANRFYRNISGALSGTQEYMAGEKLHELHESGNFDLVVVDTPPTRHALDFLDAPRRLTAFLDHKLYRALVAPTRAYLPRRQHRRPGLRARCRQGRGSRGARRRPRFLHGVRGHGAGLPRARRSRAVAAHRPEHRLRAGGIAACGHRGRGRVLRRPSCAARHPGVRPSGEPRAPRFGTGTASAAWREAKGPQAALYENLAELRTMVEGEEGHLVDLAARVSPAPVVRVPFLPHDVHDLDTLGEVASYLF